MIITFATLEFFDLYETHACKKVQNAYYAGRGDQRPK